MLNGQVGVATVTGSGKSAVDRIDIVLSSHDQRYQFQLLEEGCSNC